MTNCVRCYVDSPLGRLRLMAVDEGLTGLYYPEHRHGRNPEAVDVDHHPVLDVARRELGEYFAGQRTRFETPLAPASVRGWHRVSARSVEGAARDSVRRDPVLR